MCSVRVSDSHTTYVSLLLDKTDFSAFLANVFKWEIIWRALLNHVDFAIKSFSVYLYFEGPRKVSGNVYVCLGIDFAFYNFRLVFGTVSMVWLCFCLPFIQELVYAIYSKVKNGYINIPKFVHFFLILFIILYIEYIKWPPKYHMNIISILFLL